MAAKAGVSIEDVYKASGDVKFEGEYTGVSDLERDNILKESTDNREQGPWIVRRWKKTKKYIDKEMKIHKELVDLGHTHARGHLEPHPHESLRALVQNKIFENGMAFLIVGNCAIIGWQAELRNPEGTTLYLNMFFEHFFTFVFLVELVIRARVFNWTFWCDQENHLDIFLVVLGVLNSWILKPLSIEADFLRKATVLRILRLIRIAKQFRWQYTEMWQLLKGIVDSFETLFWTYVMIVCVLYFFGILATSLFGKSGAFDSDPEAKEIADANFKDVPQSMLTLFQLMTLDSWTGIARPLMAVHPWAMMFFIVFITISVFLLMNLITSVIVQQAFDNGKADSVELAAKKEEEKNEAMKKLRAVFHRMDEDGSGSLSREEVVAAWKDRAVRGHFRKMDIGKKDLIILWAALDNGDGELTTQEFLEGMPKLVGEAKAKDILKLYREVRVLEASIKEITILSIYSKERMNNVKLKLRTTFRMLDATRRTLGRVKETARLASKAQALCL